MSEKTKKQVFKEPKKNHFVPKQALLKNFAFNSKGRIWGLNKYSHDIHDFFPSNIKDAGAQRYLYKFPETEDSLETKFFGEIDSIGATIITKLVEHKDINILGKEDFQNLKRFVAAQSVRTPRVKADIQRFNEDIFEQLGIFSPPFEMGENEAHSSDMEIQYQGKFLEDIIHYTSQYQNEMQTWNAKLIALNNGDSFVISDNPIIKFPNFPVSTHFIQDVNFPKILGGGLLLPLSPKLLLALYSPERIDFVSMLERNKAMLSTWINYFQIDNAREFIYGKSQNALSHAIKSYSDNAKNMIIKSNPEKHNEIDDKTVIILPPRIKLEKNVIEQIKVIKNKEHPNGK